jgi:elongator complex protein 1
LELLRKHKIDLSHLASSTLLDVTALVREVRDPDRLCLFLTQVGEGKLDSSLVNDICSRVRAAVLKYGVEDEERWLPAVLTSWVQQRPPQVHEALASVAALRARHAASVPVFSTRNPRSGKNAGERALDYLTFLVPVDQLFEEALGMYDFDLVTAVAKKGQKDPQEYIPFLEGLRRMSQHRMRYTVDVRLQRWTKALASLAVEEGSLVECLKLVQDKRLYQFALSSVWSEASVARSQCYGAYASYLEGKGHLAEAAVCFSRAGDIVREVQCAEQLGDWAWMLCKLDTTQHAQRAVEVGALLDGQHRWEEVARMRAWMASAGKSADVAECLAKAGNYSEAVLWHHASAQAVILKLGSEKASLLRGHAARLKQLTERLRNLRAARKAFEESKLLEQQEEGVVENPSEYSQASVASSRASNASSTSSLATLAQGRAAQQARASKKAGGKGGSSSSQQGRRLTGKPGSMHEEEWLHREMRGLLPDEASLRATFALLVALVREGGHDVEARALQSAQSVLIEEGEAALPDLLDPCVLHGRGGVAYLQHWTPPAFLHTTVVPEHAQSPAIDQNVLTPRAAVSTTFKWKLVILD